MKLPAPRTPDPAAAPRLRWGLLGAGWIAGQMAISLRGTAQQVVAVGSRDTQRAQAFGVTVQVLPEDLSHMQINRTLGEPSDYTRAVDAYLATAVK